MKKAILFMTVLLFSLAVQAKTFNPSLKLLKIETISISEEGGDELFLHVTEYHSGGESEAVKIPAHPTFWPTEHLENVKDVPVWDGSLAEGESVELIVSLMEKDFHPWNVDDLVGTVKLRLINKDGELKTHWQVPNSPDVGEEVNTKYGPGRKFTLTGEGNRYTLHFALGR